VVTTRTRTVAARAADVWRIATDLERLPLWFPATQRVEGVSRTGWTSVAVSPRGRAVRADYSVVTTEPRRRAVWRQELEGSPYARLFAAVEYELALASEAGGPVTEVTLRVDQQLRGWARFGRFQMRRAMKRQLDGALASLASLAEGVDG
jgi:uncharacterized protein YndB with AHSA1/START domain